MYALGRTGKRRAINIWPGFVDGLATLLLVVIFVLMVFMVAQYSLSTALTGRDEALRRLELQVQELADLLALERSASADLRINIAQLSSELQSSLDTRESLRSQLAALTDDRDEISRLLEKSEERAVRLSGELEEAYKVVEADREKIEAQLAELAILQSLRDELTTQLAATDSALSEQSQRAETLADQLARTTSDLGEQQRLTAEAERKVDLLNRQINSLRRQLATIAEALEIAEAKSQEQQAQIADLGRKLNVALVNKVQELARYRSEFFGRLREVLGDRPDIRVVGDRFVFQSEVLFDTASAELQEPGKEQLAGLAQTLLEVAENIPEDIDWVLRVDGHTDRRPIRTPEFPSNWELSTARAISVVKFLIDQGVPADRLVAAGFGQYNPLDPGGDEISFRRNRRIELKLTER